MNQRQTKSYRQAPSAGLKLVGGAVPVAKPKQLRAGGLEPDESMVPGEYLAMCEGATLTSKGRSTIAVLEFRIFDGPHASTAIRQWVTIPDVDGIVPLGSRYGKQCALALGREIEVGDDLNPGAIFKSKLFRLESRLSDDREAGGISSEQHALRRKDAKDFLRVHKFLSVEELG